MTIKVASRKQIKLTEFEWRKIRLMAGKSGWGLDIKILMED
jgi:hypothetical protein